MYPVLTPSFPPLRLTGRGAGEEVASYQVLDDPAGAGQPERRQQQGERGQHRDASQLDAGHAARASAVAILAGAVDEELIARGVEGAQERGSSEEHTSELQSLMRISYAVFCLKQNI